MGQAGSRAARKSSGLIVTLDAMGTIYKFRKPVAQQYLEVGERAGLKPGISLDTVQQAFGRAFKAQNAKYQLYGKGQLEDSSVWWDLVVKNTFEQIVEDVPADLPLKLYQHFSSADAYELYPDVHPFLQTIHSIRSQLSNPDDPSLIIGIVTNSDPRVSQILRALSLKVGEVKPPTNKEIRETARESAHSGILQTPWSNAYNPANDFDFLATGYEAGAQKPNPRIWQFAAHHASIVAIAKSQMNMKLPEGRFSSIMALIGNVMSSMKTMERMKWIHIGDDFETDYLSGERQGIEVLLLDRDAVSEVEAEKIHSLTDAASIVSLLAQEASDNKLL